jgi:hypothetical protein
MREFYELIARIKERQSSMPRNYLSELLAKNPDALSTFKQIDVGALFVFAAELITADAWYVKEPCDFVIKLQNSCVTRIPFPAQFQTLPVIVLSGHQK